MAVEPSTRPDAHTVSAETEMLVPAMFQNLIGYHLRVAQETSFQAFARAAGKADLKPGWYALLTVLAERESMTPSELSRICGRDRSTLTSSLKALSHRGLIERRPNPDDQRSYSVRLTENGRRMQKQLHAIAVVYDRRLDEIAGKDKAVLIAVLGRIAATFGIPQDC
ncbi:MarR family winged helix-turn-helix transcriptional regulator [Neorhizobium galegae]|uniref:MarR family winged helix-turn-helix transcriptional regulator n=1 Tax=Neorhizobium galegae TaxID=399 RepID=UPI001F39D5ED|nr:MarR family transcriptional regulator [Neorhizobium galegae]MCQ1838839.1 MarR family transcriptional regulator [Neorhizobium galegae]UIK08207.1 MarR family transcriptional regulator [Neorhizobium galegae]